MGMKVCKECGTEISKSARVCPKCGKKQNVSGCLVAIIAVVVLAVIVAVSGGNKPTNDNSKENEEGKITLEEFNQIQTGMTYDEIVKVIGGEGTILSETNIGDTEQYHTVIYTWEGKGSIGANANVTIQNGKVMSKAQFGLE